MNCRVINTFSLIFKPYLISFLIYFYRLIILILIEYRVLRIIETEILEPSTIKRKIIIINALTI